MRDVWYSNRRSVFLPDYIQDDGTTFTNNPNLNLQSTDTIFVKEVRPDGPAYAAGLRQGDQLLTINEQSIHGKSYSQVIAMIQNTYAFFFCFIIIIINFSIDWFRSADLVLNVLSKDDETSINVYLIYLCLLTIYLPFFFLL